MKVQLVRSSLVFGLVCGMSSAVLAGPTTTTTTTAPPTTTTTTTAPPTTTTTTTAPTTTTTTAPPTTTTTTAAPTTTTTTAAPTTTTTTAAPTTTTTTTTSSTTTTTLPPSDLSGDHTFLDRVGSNLDGNNQSFLGVDTGSGQVCVAGLAQGFDTQPLPNRRVFFEYRAFGDIKQENEKRVTTTDLVPVLLRLGVEESGTLIYDETISSACTLKAKLQSAGDRAKLRLKCDVGEDLSLFPDVSDFLGSIEDAFPKQGKHIKVDTSKGRIRVTHNGEEVFSGLVDVSCSLGG